MSTVAPLHVVRPRQPKPEWLKVRAPGSENYLRLRGIMREYFTRMRGLKQQA